MIKSILDGISNALYANFENVQIVSEGIEQGIEEPCFFIDIFSETESPLLGDRAYRTLEVDVHYFPKTDTNEEIADVASKLYTVLRRVKLLDGTMINGMSLNHRTTDGVLHFFVDYKPIVYYSEDFDVEMQEDLTLKGGLYGK